MPFIPRRSFLASARDQVFFSGMEFHFNLRNM
jgi:hypothetical protein